MKAPVLAIDVKFKGQETWTKMELCVVGLDNTPWDFDLAKTDPQLFKILIGRHFDRAREWYLKAVFEKQGAKP